jgi:hypothetical protein
VEATQLSLPVAQTVARKSKGVNQQAHSTTDHTGVPESIPLQKLAHTPDASYSETLWSAAKLFTSQDIPSIQADEVRLLMLLKTNKECLGVVFCPCGRCGKVFKFKAPQGYDIDALTMPYP